jgi:hypothetical protein
VVVRCGAPKLMDEGARQRQQSLRELFNGLRYVPR